MVGLILRNMFALRCLEHREKIKQDCTVIQFVCKTHPPVHIGGYVLAGAMQ